jgi:hypothetical protein
MKREPTSAIQLPRCESEDSPLQMGKGTGPWLRQGELTIPTLQRRERESSAAEAGTYNGEDEAGPMAP